MVSVSGTGEPLQKLHFPEGPWAAAPEAAPYHLCHAPGARDSPAPDSDPAHQGDPTGLQVAVTRTSWLNAGPQIPSDSTGKKLILSQPGLRGLESAPASISTSVSHYFPAACRPKLPLSWLTLFLLRNALSPPSSHFASGNLNPHLKRQRCVRDALLSSLSSLSLSLSRVVCCFGKRSCDGKGLGAMEMTKVEAGARRKMT